MGFRAKGVMRPVMVDMIWLPWGAVAQAEGYADYGSPDQCGTCSAAEYTRESWFPGGKAGQWR